MPPVLGKDQVTVGSAPDNDVVLAGPAVAAHHAHLVRRGGQLFFVMSDGTGNTIGFKRETPAW